MPEPTSLNRLAKQIWGDNPLQREYGPLDALMIGAGYATSGLFDNSVMAYYAARRNLADALGDPRARSIWQGAVDTRRNELAEHERLYAPLTRAYPYFTAAGEALPAIGAAIPTGGVSLAPAGISIADRYAQEAARAGGYSPQGVYGPLRQVLTGTSPAEALRKLLAE